MIFFAKFQLKYIKGKIMVNHLKKEACLTKQKGNSLIEYGFYLALVGAALAILMMVNSGTKASALKGQEVTDITKLAQNVRDYFATQGNYVGLTEGMIVTGNLAPRSMLIGATTPGTGTLVNTTKKAVTLAPADIGGVASIGFTITGNLDTENCSGVVSNIQDQFAIISVGGAVVKLLNEPLQMAALTTACAGDATGLVPFIYTSY